MNYGARVKAIRKSKGIKAKFVAKSIGLSPSDYCQLEGGRRRLTAELIVEIAKVLGVTTDRLLALDRNSSQSASEELATALESAD